jgi:hypothetical protein
MQVNAQPKLSTVILRYPFFPLAFMAQLAR